MRVRRTNTGGAIANCVVVAALLVVVAAVLVPGLSAARKQAKKRDCT